VISQKATATGKFLLLTLALTTAGYVAAAVEDEIRARIQPHGEVCEFGDDCAAGLTLPGDGGGEPKDPETVYTTYCFACHGTGANNAPVMGNAEQWAPRVAKGIDALYDSAINGFNNGAMPPKGLCTTCSDDEVKATVDHILAQSE
jgi:cytochrome c5